MLVCIRNALRSCRDSQQSMVGTATHYKSDGLETESHSGQDFLCPSRLALRPTQPTVHWVPHSSHGQSVWGVMLTSHPLLVPSMQMGQSYTSAFSTHALACHGVTFTFYLLAENSHAVIGMIISHV